MILLNHAEYCTCTPKVVKAHWRNCMIMKRRRKKINPHWLKISHFLLIIRAAVRIARLSLRDAMEHYDTYNLIGWLLWPRTIKLNSFTHHLYWKKLRFVNLLDNCSSVQLSIVIFFTKQRSVWNVVIIIITVGFNGLPHRMHLLHTSKMLYILIPLDYPDYPNLKGNIPTW